MRLPSGYGASIGSVDHNTVPYVMLTTCLEAAHAPVHQLQTFSSVSVALGSLAVLVARDWAGSVRSAHTR